jgi:phosphoglycerol geranylgeranyltransferase
MISTKPSILKDFLSAINKGEKQTAVLIDPDKFSVDKTAGFINSLPSWITHIFIGGSTDEYKRTVDTVRSVKAFSQLPVILFPGDHTQITDLADGLLFLSLISGRNPEYLIEQQIQAAEKLKASKLEVIPTGYILIDGGKESAVEKVSNTRPISQQNIPLIVNTALAGQFSGKKLIYLEAGSGARTPVSAEIISAVKKAINIPLIVGGGIRTIVQQENAFKAGAHLIVIGTAFEDDFVTPSYIP